MAHIYYRAERNTKYPWRVQFVQRERGKKKNMSCSFETKKEALSFAKKWEKVFCEQGKEAVEYKKKKRGRRRQWVT